MQKVSAILAVLLLFGTVANSQNLDDAVRYSFLSASGTARVSALGGSMTALGADFATISTNPAGLAAFRSSELSVTPLLAINNTNSLLLGAGNADVDARKSYFNFANVGIVLHAQPRNPRWTTFNFAIGFNRLATFQKKFRYHGNTSRSIADRFVALANTKTIDELDAFEAYPAYFVGAIYPENVGSTNYKNDFSGAESQKFYHSQVVSAKGSLNEVAIAIASNYDEKLMIGATLGIPIINYEETRNYEERDEHDSIAIFDALRFDEYVKTKGAGINLKLGAIYRINQMFRVGIGIHTPTAFFDMQDDYSTNVGYDFTIGTNGQISTDTLNLGSFKYGLTTPFRVNSGLGVIVGKHGFISADVEYVDYAAANFNLSRTGSSADDKAYEDELNNQISDKLKGNFNYRFGGEFAYDVLRLRAGLSLLGSPFVNNSDFRRMYSFGAGIREKSFFIDFAYVVEHFDEVFVPYTVVDATPQVADNQLRNSTFQLTLGYRF